MSLALSIVILVLVCLRVCVSGCGVCACEWVCDYVLVSSRQYGTCSVLYLRDADFKQVVLDELFAQHGDTELNTQLHQATCVGTLVYRRDSSQPSQTHR